MPEGIPVDLREKRLVKVNGLLFHSRQPNMPQSDSLGALILLLLLEEVFHDEPVYTAKSGFRQEAILRLEHEG